MPTNGFLRSDKNDILIVSNTLGVLVLVCPVILETVVWYMANHTCSGTGYGNWYMLADVMINLVYMTDVTSKYVR